jgi:hypothetical protein
LCSKRGPSLWVVKTRDGSNASGELFYDFFLGASVHTADEGGADDFLIVGGNDVPVKSFYSDGFCVGLVSELPVVFDLGAELDGGCKADIWVELVVG